MKGFFKEIEFWGNKNPKLGFAPRVSKTKFKLHGISNKFVVGEICQLFEGRKRIQPSITDYFTKKTTNKNQIYDLNSL